MINEKNAHVCKIDIVDEIKVDAARKSLVETSQIFEMAEIYKLLGEPTRLKLLLSLMTSELCVCDLAAVIDSTVSAVSHQLRLLRNARLVKYRKNGKMVYYSIDDEHIEDLIHLLKEHIREK
jgi:ArsR family transcriptional regulator